MSEKSIIASSFSLTKNYAKEIMQRGYGERYNVREEWLYMCMSTGHRGVFKTWRKFYYVLPDRQSR